MIYKVLVKKPEIYKEVIEAMRQAAVRALKKDNAELRDALEALLSGVTA